MNYEAKPNYYKELNLTPQATKDDIKKSFRKLALEHHPDVGGDEEKFKKINEAYSTLIDEEKRRNYDTRSTEPRIFSGTNGNPFGSFTHMFSSMFNLNGRRVHPASHQSGVKLENTEYVVELTLDDVYYGSEKKLKVNTECRCECINVCGMCNGVGTVQEIMQGRGMIKLVTNGCGTCLGRGFISKKGVECGHCKGNGMYQKEEIYTLAIDAGISSGSMLKFEEKGKQATKVNQISGDLIIKFEVKPITTKVEELQDGVGVKVNIKGLDIHMELTIDIMDVVLGTKKIIKYFDKEVEIDTYAEVMEEKKEYIYKEKGITDKGNLIITYKYKYDILSKINVEHKEKMRQIISNL